MKMLVILEFFLFYNRWKCLAFCLLRTFFSPNLTSCNYFQLIYPIWFLSFSIIKPFGLTFLFRSRAFCTQTQQSWRGSLFLSSKYLSFVLWIVWTWWVSVCLVDEGVPSDFCSLNISILLWRSSKYTLSSMWFIFEGSEKLSISLSTICMSSS